MKARFSGTCPACNDSIRVGKEIVRDSQDRWVHKACSDIEDEIP